MAKVSMALLTTHYGDLFWVQLLLRRFRSAFPGIEDSSVYVIDQDRTATSRDQLRALLGNVNILRYPPSQPHFDMTGHDHARVLNLAVRDVDEDVLLLFDSDAHPLVERAPSRRISELLTTKDALLAGARRPGADGTDTHPCFMVFGPRVDRAALYFDEGQLERGVDTGRKIYGQVARGGLEVELLRPEPAFGGLWGNFYLGGSIYHHGSGSFGSSRDPRFQRQVATWRREEKLVRRRVARGQYRLGAAETSLILWSRRIRAARARAAAALRRRGTSLWRRLRRS